MREKLVLYPTSVEELLSINKSERLRLQEEGKLIVSHYIPFRVYGKSFNCRMYDYREIHKITQSNIETWRDEYNQLVDSGKFTYSHAIDGPYEGKVNIYTISNV